MARLRWGIKTVPQHTTYDTLRNPVTIWVVRHGDDLYIRSVNGRPPPGSVARRRATKVSDVAEAHGLPMAQVALAWMLSKPVVTAPIIGATKPQHLDDAVAAVAVQLTPDEIRQLEEAYQPHPVLGYA